MKSFAKLSLLMLLGFTAVEAVTLQQAKAGNQQAGVTTPDASSIGIDFTSPTFTGITAEAIRSNPALAAAIRRAITAQANILIAGTSPKSPVPGETVPPLSPAAASALKALLTATTSEAAATAVIAVAAQITSEVNLSAGTETAITAVAEAIAALVLSPDRLPEAIAAINALIESASRAELETLAKSPTFMALRQALEAAKTPVFL